jgi:putative ABC transport system ATP-binding protein
MQKLRFEEFGFIFQHHYLIHYLSVIENVCIKKGTSEEKAKKILNKVGLAEMYDKKIYTLSGGQKQRVAIARAIVDDPRVIFADEPTASLDYENAREIYDLLQKVSENKLLIMATHDRSLMKGNETIYRFENRRIINE